MAIFKPNLALLTKLSNSFASFHYDADVPTVQKARAPTVGTPECELFTKAMNAAKVEIAAKGTPCPYATIHKTSDYVVSIGAKLNYKRKVEATMARGGVEGTYKPSARPRGMFPVYGELLFVSDDLKNMYFVVYQASVPKTVWSSNGVTLKKENVVQWIKDTKPYNKMCGKVEKNEICDQDDFVIYQQDEDGNVLLDDKGEPLTMSLPQYRNVLLQNADVRIKGKKLNLVTDEVWSESELAAIRDAYYAKFAAETAEK